MEEKIFESLFLDIKFKNKTITVGCIYRAPFNDAASNSAFVNELKLTLQQTKKKRLFCTR